MHLWAVECVKNLAHPLDNVSRVYMTVVITGLFALIGYPVQEFDLLFLYLLLNTFTVVIRVNCFLSLEG